MKFVAFIALSFIVILDIDNGLSSSINDGYESSGSNDLNPKTNKSVKEDYKIEDLTKNFDAFTVSSDNESENLHRKGKLMKHKGPVNSNKSRKLMKGSSSQVKKEFQRPVRKSEKEVRRTIDSLQKRISKLETNIVDVIEKEKKV